MNMVHETIYLIYITISFETPIFFILRLDKLKVEQCGPQEINHVANNRPPLTQPEIQNNERNREVVHEHTVAVTSTAPEDEQKQRDAERYGFQKDGAERERPLTKINSIKLQPAQAAAVKANIASPQTPSEMDGLHRSPRVNGSGEQCPANGMGGPPQRSPTHEPDRTLSRTSSMQQLEQWVRTQRGRNQDDDTRRSVWSCEDDTYCVYLCVISDIVKKVEK